MELNTWNAWRAGVKVVALDLETTGLDPRRDTVLLLGLAAKGREPLGLSRAYLTPDPWSALSQLREWFDGPDAPIVVGHNLAFDLQFLWGLGLNPRRLWDTMLAEQLLTAGLDLSLDLASVVHRRLQVTLDKATQKSFIGADPATFVPTVEQLEYLKADVIHLIPLAKSQGDALEQAGLIGPLPGRPLSAFGLEMQVLPAFAAMSLVGMRLDVDAHAAVVAGYQARADEAAAHVSAALAPHWERLEDARYATQFEDYDASVQTVRTAQLLAKELRALCARKAATDQDRAALDGAVERLAAARKGRLPKPPAPAPFNLNSRGHVLAGLAELGIDLDDLQAQTVRDRLVIGLRKRGVPVPERATVDDVRACLDAAPQLPERTRAACRVLLALLAWKDAAKVVSTYGAKLAARVGPDGRVHAQYVQMVSTGRTASRQPNAQNMPPAIRHCFVPEDGNAFVVADFSGMELRLAAALSGDPVMVQAFRDGADLHKLTATKAYSVALDQVTKEQRSDAKTANFAILYGAGGRGLEARGLVAAGDGDRLLGGFRELYAVAYAWREDQGNQALSSGRVRTALGRVRWFPSFGAPPPRPELRRDWERLKAAARREAGNCPIQGTGADIAKLALLRLWDACTGGRCPDPTRPLLGFRALAVNMVHDELVVETRAGHAERLLPFVQSTMAQAGRDVVGDTVDIPAEAVVAGRWDK